MHRQVSVALVAMSWIVSGVVYSRLPERMATHYDLAGSPDRWDARVVGAFIVPVVMLITLLLARWTPRTLPGPPRDDALDAIRDLVLTAILAFFALMHVGILGAALDWRVTLPQLLPLGLGGLFLLFGHVLPRLRRSWMIGIRTRRTLTSDHAWERTHRVTGAILTLGGTIMVGAGLFVGSQPMSIVIVAAVGSALATAGYLYSVRE